VIAPAAVVPKSARLIGLAGETIQANVTITPPIGNKFDIISVNAEDGHNIRFQIEKKSESDMRKFTLNVSNIKPDPGRYSDKIILKTTSTISPEITIRVYGIIREK